MIYPGTKTERIDHPRGSFGSQRDGMVGVPVGCDGQLRFGFFDRQRRRRNRELQKVKIKISPASTVMSNRDTVASGSELAEQLSHQDVLSGKIQVGRNGALSVDRKRNDRSVRQQPRTQV